MLTRSIARLAKAVLRDRRAATAVEYGLIIGLIVIATFAAMRNVADASTRMWNYVTHEVLTRS